MTAIPQSVAELVDMLAALPGVVAVVLVPCYTPASCRRSGASSLGFARPLALEQFCQQFGNGPVLGSSQRPLLVQ